MATYKVNRRIEHDGNVYKPGSEIELADAQAALMTQGQISAIPAEEETEAERDSKPPTPKVVAPNPPPGKQGTQPAIPPTGTKDDKGPAAPAQ